ncbi:MAG: hypothetical protein Q9211_003438 [Gyalolechia sp. 1 TL-2023]
MISPTASFVDDLAARATVDTISGNVMPYDGLPTETPTSRADTPAPTGSILAVPGVGTLPESQRIAVLKKVRPRFISGQLDADALQLRLQAITPPPDEEEDNEESRLLEAQARQDLESDGCAPATRPISTSPYETRPRKYWQSFSSTDDVVLCAQGSDWRNFRQAQRRLRHSYRNKSFSIFVDDVRGRRRARSLDDNVHLLWDLQQQSRQQDWIEFQDYHLKLHELQEKKYDGLQKELDKTQREVGGTDVEGSERAAQQERAIHQRLEYAETTLRWHEVILCWIEQCRLTMDSLSPRPVEKGSGDHNSSSSRQRLPKRPNTLPVLGKVRVSKSTLKSPNIRNRTTKARISTPLSLDSAVTTPSTTQQIPKRREIKPRRAKENALGQLLPQRVDKANRFADTVTKSRSRI